MKQIVSFFDLLQAFSGVAVSGPLFYFSFAQLSAGNVVMGVLTGVFGLVSFFLPGYLLRKYVEYVRDFKRSLYSRITAYIPFM